MMDSEWDYKIICDDILELPEEQEFEPGVIHKQTTAILHRPDNTVGELVKEAVRNGWQIVQVSPEKVLLRRKVDYMNLN
jgi:hypothetical protein